MKRIFFLIFIVVTFLMYFAPDAGCAVYEADYRPWSGYWWPLSKGGLATGIDYKGYPSPLSKYDYVVTRTYYGPAQNYGLRVYYDPDALSWEGMCAYWAAAAVLEDEPIHKGIHKGTAFRVGDKKALLTVAYHGVLFNKYRIKAPTDFHAVLEDFIRNQKTPVILDLGSNGEVWWYPVFKYESNYTQKSSVRHYTTKIYYATNAVHPDYVGTAVSKATYDYYFVLDDSNNIIDSGWEGNSVTSPPKNAYEPFGTEPDNPGIDYTQVKAIVASDDDAFEENDTFDGATALSSGGYSLLSMDEDYFKIELAKGDRLHVRISDNDENGVQLRSYTPDRELVKETVGDGQHMIEAKDAGPVYLEAVPLDPSLEMEYTLNLQHMLTHFGVFPLNPSGTFLNGVALTDPETHAGRTIITLVDRDGFAQDSYQSHTTPGQVKGTIENDFQLVSTGNGYIRVDSDFPHKGLHAATDGNFLLLGSNFIPAETAAPVLFFPYFNKHDGWKTYFGLINVGDRTETVLRSAFTSNGELVDSDTIILEPGQKIEYDTYFMGILSPEAKSVRASTVSGRASIIGYIMILNPSFASRGRALIPICSEESTELVVPHVVSNGHWSSTVAVMNAGFQETTVNFFALDEAGNILGVSEQMFNSYQSETIDLPVVFPGIAQDAIAALRIRSVEGQPLGGLLMYESADRLQLAGFPLRGSQSDPLILSHLANSGSWSTGIGVMNAGETDTDVVFSIFSSIGELLDARVWQLSPNQRLAMTINDLFDHRLSAEAGYLVIESAGSLPLSGIYVFGNPNGTQLMGDTLQPD